METISCSVEKSLTFFYLFFYFYFLLLEFSGACPGGGSEWSGPTPAPAHGRFLPARRYASAGLCDSDMSVCPDVRLSGRPSHAGIVHSRAKAGS